MAKRTLSMKTERGGLKVPDLIAMNCSNRVMWICRTIRSQDASFVQVLQKRSRSELKDIVQLCYDITRINNRAIPEYYKEMFDWFKTIAKEPDTAKEFRRQLIWQN